MDLSGENQEKKTFENISLNYLLIANVPRQNDDCFPPNPFCPWLEMYVDPKTGAPGLANDKKQHISELELECNNPSHTFEVVVDGQSFGPYHHIKISQVYRKKNESKIEEK